jgi:hypothetical protein
MKDSFCPPEGHDKLQIVGYLPFLRLSVPPADVRYGSKADFGLQAGMSALLPEADLNGGLNDP